MKFLTDEGDLVVDPFAGSNMTGAVAEELRRKWITIEKNREYAKDSLLRFRYYETSDENGGEGIVREPQGLLPFMSNGNKANS